MKKEFNIWNEKKKIINNHPDESIVYFKELDIWWCRIGINIGFEQDGKGSSFSRPVLILKKFNQFLFWAIPLSIKLKNNPYYVQCVGSDKIIRSAMISQLKLVSSKRLTDKIGIVEKDSFELIKKRIKDLL